MSKTLYDTDFYAWTQDQAAHLRAKKWPALDVDNLAEEIESLGRSQRKALRSYLRNLLIHLLKWTYQPDQRPQHGRSWRTSIRHARREIADELRDSPSLRPLLPVLVPDVYAEAREDAAEETGLPLATFLEACPWDLDQLQDRAFPVVSRDEAMERL